MVHVGTDLKELLPSLSDYRRLPIERLVHSLLFRTVMVLILVVGASACGTVSQGFRDLGQVNQGMRAMNGYVKVVPQFAGQMAEMDRKVDGAMETLDAMSADLEEMSSLIRTMDTATISADVTTLRATTAGISTQMNELSSLQSMSQSLEATTARLGALEAGLKKVNDELGAISPLQHDLAKVNKQLDVLQPLGGLIEAGQKWKVLVLLLAGIAICFHILATLRHQALLTAIAKGQAQAYRLSVEQASESSKPETPTRESRFRVCTLR